MGATASSETSSTILYRENNDPMCVLRTLSQDYTEDPVHTVTQDLALSNLSGCPNATHLTSFEVEGEDVFFSDVTLTFSKVNESMKGCILRLCVLDENGMYVDWSRTQMTNASVTLFTLCKDKVGFFVRGEGRRKIHVFLSGDNVANITDLGIQVQYNIYANNNVIWNAFYSTQSSFSYVSPSDGSKDITAMIQGDIWNLYVSSNGTECLFSLDFDDGAHAQVEADDSDDSSDASSNSDDNVPTKYRHYNDFKHLLSTYEVDSYHIDEVDETVYLCTDSNVRIDVLVTRKFALLV